VWLNFGLMDLRGVGPVVAARTLADVGHVARFADRNRFASWTGTAPIEASSGNAKVWSWLRVPYGSAAGKHFGWSLLMARRHWTAASYRIRAALNAGDLASASRMERA
jgi:Transposase IS116/IS110/IS902 family